MPPEHLQLLVTRAMPYGKYKGRLIADLPSQYLNWFARKGFPPGLQDEATKMVLVQAELLSAIWAAA